MPESADKFHEIKEWLKEKDLPSDNIHEYFADGVAIASMLKSRHPSLIDMNVYAPHSSYQRRLITWKALNFQVFSVLNIKLSKENLESLAKAEPGAIEALLEKLMQLERKVDDLQDAFTLGEDDVLTIAGEGNETIKLVAFEKYEKAVKAVEYKESLVTAEQRKCKHLQNLMKLREERVAELRQQLAEFCK